ncbi:MAG: hypothetical protein WCO56_11225 [Verrucomicrobiota bacterium]
MKLRRNHPSDSLYMLLDTMCNAFGGIVLLAVLVTLLTSKERGKRSESASDTQEMLNRRLTLAQTNLQHSQELAVQLQNKANDERWKKQVTLLATRKELQAGVTQAKEDVTQNNKELATAANGTPAERLKFLNAQMATVQARKLEAQNSLSAANENNKRLKQRAEALQQQVSEVINESQHSLRLPKEYATGKHPFYVIVQYGSIYPCRYADMRKNELSIKWTSIGGSDIANPIPGSGYAGGDSTRIRDLFKTIPRDDVYLTFCVFEDSFPEFNKAKQIATALNLPYGWEPFLKQNGPVTFSSVGHRPKPQ